MQNQAESGNTQNVAPRFQDRKNVAADKPASQANAIRRHLEAGKTLTALDALNLFGCFRLAARIHDPQGTGLSISARTVQVGVKRVAEYSLGGVAT